MATIAQEVKVYTTEYLTQRRINCEICCNDDNETDGQLLRKSMPTKDFNKWVEGILFANNYTAIKRVKFYRENY